MQQGYDSWDHPGSTRMVTDENGNIISRHDYLPFGGEIPSGFAGRSGALYGYSEGVSARFTGQERDTESGLDNFQARFMASPQGRFASPDPANFGASVGNPHSWNGYSYALDGPMTFVDPDGLDADPGCMFM